MHINIKNFITINSHKNYKRKSVFCVHAHDNIYHLATEKKFLVFILSILFLLNFVYNAFSDSPTFVSGTITTDTTWILADSPYVVQGPVIVSGNTTLTVDPGVVVKFALPN
ncbi:MAG: hypothetical protein A3G49_05795, partial [Candidatus Sungbacteria bacterium RIFCSPLOWO2_12_FULL_41_11]